MSHLSDKDIDRLAQEAAEQLDIDQNSSGWDALEKTLDQEMPTEKKRRRRWLFFILLPAALLGGIFAVYQRMNSSHSKPESIYPITESITSIPPDAPTDQANNGKNTPSLQPSKNDLAGSGSPSGPTGVESVPTAQTTPPHIDQELANRPDGPKQQAFQQASKTVGSNPGARAKRQQGLISPKHTEDQSSLPTIALAEKETELSDREKDAPIVDSQKKSGVEEIAELAPEKQPSGNASGIPATDSIHALPDSVMNKGIQPDPAEDTLAKTLTPPSNLKHNKSSPSMPLKGLVFGLLSGPDISDVNRKGTGKTGINLGLSAGYRLNSRITILSGLFYTHKFYTAYGNDYKPPKGLWFDTVTLRRVVGDCFMYEIPVNLRFDLIARNRNFLFASVGLSSYLMKKENYDFHFTGNSGYYGSWYRSYKVKENYWLGVLNLSAGYERMLGKQWSVMAEPYIKLPLKGLGFGNMQLNSYGFYLGARFQPQKAKKK